MGKPKDYEQFMEEYMKVNYPYEYTMLKKDYRENAMNRVDDYSCSDEHIYSVSDEILELTQPKDIVFPGGAWYNPGLEVDIKTWREMKRHKSASYKRTNYNGVYFNRRNSKNNHS